MENPMSSTIPMSPELAHRLWEVSNNYKQGEQSIRTPDKHQQILPHNQIDPSIPLGQGDPPHKSLQAKEEWIRPPLTPLLNKKRNWHHGSRRDGCCCRFRNCHTWASNKKWFIYFQLEAKLNLIREAWSPICQFSMWALELWKPPASRRLNQWMTIYGKSNQPLRISATKSSQQDGSVNGRVFDIDENDPRALIYDGNGQAFVQFFISSEGNLDGNPKIPSKSQTDAQSREFAPIKGSSKESPRALTHRNNDPSSSNQTPLPPSLMSRSNPPSPILGYDILPPNSSGEDSSASYRSISLDELGEREQRKIERETKKLNQLPVWYMDPRLRPTEVEVLEAGKERNSWSGREWSFSFAYALYQRKEELPPSLFYDYHVILMELVSKRVKYCNEQIENFLKESEPEVQKDKEFEARLKEVGTPINVRTQTDEGKKQGHETLASYHQQHGQEEVGLPLSVVKYQPVDAFLDVF
ncbi:hypothetical protein H6P81_015852 [Aristolochia fimbriata]|uniref:Uncharacterized protein n=1 Tax=Aristolochia fimbriata TaxID=158543 RepID=A0AAV7E9U1_ARIFI|nr:hypothetical protein H6P81_015852 [Aristolochia fimbriata]